MASAPDLGTRAFQAARAMVGVRFVARGRDPVRGVDCVGLVAVAYALAGHHLNVPGDYPLRGWGSVRIARWIARAGVEALPVTGSPRDGDVAIVEMAAGQWHFGIVGRDPAGGHVLVHAHAGLRRVVAGPYAPDAAAGLLRVESARPRGDDMQIRQGDALWQPWF